MKNNIEKTMRELMMIENHILNKMKCREKERRKEGREREGEGERKKMNEKISFNHSNCQRGENERKRDQMMFEYTQHDSFDGNICIVSLKHEMNTNGKKKQSNPISL